MKLYLSSDGVGEDPSLLQKLAGHAGRAALVFNARDGYGAERLKYSAQEAESIGALGFDCEELDLRAYFHDFEALCALLESCNLVWVVGGNTFVLARAMTQARFREAMAEPLSENRIVYAGYSAGACVTGPDLDGCHLMDEPDDIPEGYRKDVAPKTLGWVPWRIVPHWRSEHVESSLAELAVEHLLVAGLPFQALRDGQAFVVNVRDRCSSEI